MKLFDSHAHLLDARFSQDLDDVIRGMSGIICIYSPDEDMEKYERLLNEPYIWGAAGIHPHDAKNVDSLWDILIEVLDKNKVVAIGEIGLDFYYDNSPRDQQKYIFERQLELASERNMPAVIHSREAFSQTMDILKASDVKKVLVHCFSGDVHQLQEALKLNCYISVGGPVTFPKADILREVVKEIPLNKLLIETDCPYLAPQPVRGKRNEPGFIRYIISEIALLKKRSEDEIAGSIYNNTKEFFCLTVN